MRFTMDQSDGIYNSYSMGCQGFMAPCLRAMPSDLVWLCHVLLQLHMLELNMGKGRHAHKHHDYKINALTV